MTDYAQTVFTSHSQIYIKVTEHYQIGNQRYKHMKLRKIVQIRNDGYGGVTLIANVLFPITTVRDMDMLRPMEQSGVEALYLQPRKTFTHQVYLHTHTHNQSN